MEPGHDVTDVPRHHECCVKVPSREKVNWHFSAQSSPANYFVVLVLTLTQNRNPAGSIRESVTVNSVCFFSYIRSPFFHDD